MCDPQKKKKHVLKSLNWCQRENRSMRSSVVKKTAGNYLKLWYKTNGKWLSIHYWIMDALGKLAKHSRS